MAGRREDAAAFAKKWAGKGDEKQHTQLYWIDFFTNVLGCEDALERLRFEVPSSTEASAHKGYADVLIPTARAIVEQKSLGIVVLDHFGYWDFSYNLSCLNSRRKRRSSYGHQG